MTAPEKRADPGDVLANGPSVGDWEPLDLISLADNQVAFRTMTGHFLSCDPPASAATLSCKGASLSIQPSNVFTYEYLS